MFAAVASALALLLAQASAPASAAASAAPPAALPTLPPEPPARPDPFVNPVTPEKLALGRILTKRTLPEHLFENSTAALTHFLEGMNNSRQADKADALDQKSSDAFIAALKDLDQYFDNEIEAEYAKIFAQRLTLKEMKEEINYYNNPYSRLFTMTNPLKDEERDALMKRLGEAGPEVQESFMQQMIDALNVSDDVTKRYLLWMKQDFEPKFQSKVFDRFCFYKSEGNKAAYQQCMTGILRVIQSPSAPTPPPPPASPRP